MQYCWKYVAAHIALSVWENLSEYKGLNKVIRLSHMTNATLSMQHICGNVLKLLATQYFKIFLELRPDVKVTVTRK